MTKTTALNDNLNDNLDGKLDRKAPQKLRIGREMFDTTWRITVPVLLFAVAGLFIDKAVGSKPWVTLLGAAIGFYFAAQLVKRQIMSGIESDAASAADAGDGTEAKP